MAPYDSVLWSLDPTWAVPGAARLRDYSTDPDFVVAPSHSMLGVRSVEGLAQKVGKCHSCGRVPVLPLDEPRQNHVEARWGPIVAKESARARL